MDKNYIDWNVLLFRFIHNYTDCHLIGKWLKELLFFSICVLILVSENIIYTLNACLSQEVDGGDEIDEAVDAEDDSSILLGDVDDSVQGDADSLILSCSLFFSNFLIRTSAAKAKANKIKMISKMGCSHRNGDRNTPEEKMEAMK